MFNDLPKATDRTIDDFNGVEPDFEEKLEFYDPRKNHNKFWICQVYNFYIVRRWGRHGSKGQTLINTAWNKWRASDAAKDMVQQKRDKGYRSDKTTILDHIARKVN